MTITAANTDGGVPVAPKADLVSLTIDGVAISVPKGTLIIRAAEQLGVAVPRFCDHPLLDPVAACRMCLIEVEGMPKPQPACAVACGDGMVVHTQVTSSMAEEAQRSVMEFLLINHPLDCPVCDKGGECPLQNQAMTNGQAETRFDGPKRTFPKPINLSAQVLLDRERCVSCARCTRFAEQIAGDPYIELLERGSGQQVGIAADRPFNSYFSGNTIQICPVGALTSAMYRFRSRPFDLVSTRTACEHCASGCLLRTDSRRGTVMRRLAAVDPDVNEEWNCDKGRFAFRYASSKDRLQTPLVREGDELRPASWVEALTVAASGLSAARDKVGVLVGGRLSLEDAYAYSVFARVALATNNVDFRARAASAEEEHFLGAHVAGKGVGPTYADLEAAPAILLVAFEPEDESPIVFLRLRKAVQVRGLPVFSVAPMRSAGMRKLHGTLLGSVPGDEPALIQQLSSPDATDSNVRSAAEALRQPGAVVLVGERAAAVPGLLSSLSSLTKATGARIGWVPRRAGERGALEAGLLPSLLPGGRPVADAGARVDVAAVLGVQSLPQTPGLDADHMFDAAAAGGLKAFVVGGVALEDLPTKAASALRAADFVVALDTREHEVTALADVVLPVAAAPEKPGTFLNWEGRPRPFDQVVRHPLLMSDARVLSALADELGVPLRLGDIALVQRQMAEFGIWQGDRVAPPATVVPANSAEARLVLASWRPLLDAGSLQQDEPYLAATARPTQLLVSTATATKHGVMHDELVVVKSDSGRLPGRLTVADVVDDVVVALGYDHGQLGPAGAHVTLSRGES